MIESMIEGNYDRRTKERNDKNWKEKSLHGKFPKSIVDFVNSVSSQWLRSGYVKKNKTQFTAAQDQALRTNWIKANINVVDCFPLCRVCHSVDESFMHVSSGCEQQEKWRYLIRHNLIASSVQWELCRKSEIKVTRNWYEHVPLPRMVAQTEIAILWDVEIGTTTKIKDNRPDIVAMMPGDHNIVSTENDKVCK